MRRLITCLAAVIFAVAPAAHAWNNHGHMAVAAVAWAHMTPAAQRRAGELLKLNPDYAKWIADAAPGDEDRVAFLKAATWPDEIKHTKGYHNDGYKPADPRAGDMTDYSDMLQHKGWHFIDLPFSPDGTPTEPPFGVNVVTQIEKAEANLASRSASDAAKSYALVWLEHLVGDLHQPLHATSRFTAALPGGDTGGNLVNACSDERTTCGAKDNLHAFWDDVTGKTSKVASVDSYVERLKPANRDQVAISDPTKWADESEDLAQQFVYAAPVGTGTDNSSLTKDYRANAKKVAATQIELAGERLAVALNVDLR